MGVVTMSLSMHWMHIITILTKIVHMDERLKQSLVMMGNKRMSQYNYTGQQHKEYGCRFFHLLLINFIVGCKGISFFPKNIITLVNFS